MKKFLPILLILNFSLMSCIGLGQAMSATTGEDFYGNPYNFRYWDWLDEEPDVLKNLQAIAIMDIEEAGSLYYYTIKLAFIIPSRKYEDIAIRKFLDKEVERLGAIAYFEVDSYFADGRTYKRSTNNKSGVDKLSKIRFVMPGEDPDEVKEFYMKD